MSLPSAPMLVDLRYEGQSLARAAVDGGARPIGVTLPVLRQAADRLLSEAARQQGVEPACRPGCAACCRQLVPLAAAEAADLRQRIAEMPEAPRARLKARFGRAVGELDRAHLRELMSDTRQIPSEGLAELGLQYLAARIDCPFLEEERCLIYADRPMACRQHAVSSDAAECRTGGRVRRIMPKGRAMNAVLDAAAGTSWVPLVLCLEQPPEGPGQERSAAEWLRLIWRAAT